MATKMRNNFTEETRALFLFKYDCYECSKNNNHELHHIMGRGHKPSKCERSALNASLLCHDCHENAVYLDKEKLLHKTIKYLISINYKFKEIDYEFFEKYKKYYENI